MNQPVVLSPHDPVAVALTQAVRSGDVGALNRLLAARPGSATVRVGDSACSRTLLHIATDWPGHLPNVATTIVVLTDGGADPNARFIGRSHQETPLHWAASADDVDALVALIVVGADINALGGVMAGGSPLEDARIFAQWNAARLLVDRGAATAIDDEAALGLMSPLRLRFSARDNWPSLDQISQAFWYSCHGGQLIAAQFLLEQGADLDWVPPWETLTPLDAARRSHERNNIEAHDLFEWLHSKHARSADPR